ncbi:hypothetical protein DPMN_005621 [Dreissena polymorpha]|uniref:Uncharacterized protein n=1 Tax=Dreissena polymorpha TaxID=45954 RepID=A0A9D4MTX5_DREPO|nr:hypothetical protein DPMN_005621 [Dreissena polymorpha]
MSDMGTRFEPFDSCLHDTVSEDDILLTLRDIAELPIGHVPLTLASSFRNLIYIGAFVLCEAIDLPQPIFPPWPEPQEKAGGVVIPCAYIVRHENKELAIDIIKGALMSMTEGEFIRRIM